MGNETDLEKPEDVVRTGRTSLDHKTSPPRAAPYGPRWALALLSVFIVYHLLVVLLMPNDTSLEARAVSRPLLAYANTLAFHTPWVFFSPGPSPVFYLEYEVETGEQLNDTDLHIFPAPKEGRGYNDKYNRALYSMRYFALNQERLERYLVPWLCARHPGATALYVRAVFEQVPGIEKKWLGETFGDMLQRVDVDRERLACPESGDGAPAGPGEPEAPSDASAETDASEEPPKEGP